MRENSKKVESIPENLLLLQNLEKGEYQKLWLS